jgi:two-component system CheB/CheR fusion protein
MLQILLQSYGVKVISAENGEEGAALIERARPDLALVDLGLPVMSGFDVAKRVRANRAFDRTRLVALSGYGRDTDVQAALDAGFDEHLTKPPDLGRLEQMLSGETSPPPEAGS